MSIWLRSTETVCNACRGFQGKMMIAGFIAMCFFLLKFYLRETWNPIQAVSIVSIVLFLVNQFYGG